MFKFLIKHQFTYSAEVIPPRCKKPRRQEFDGEMTIEIPFLTQEEAPVAIIETEENAAPLEIGAEKSTRIREYRWYNNKFWYNHKIDCFRETRFDFDINNPSIPSKPSSFQSLEEHHKHAHEWASSKIIVDGILYQELKGEPRLYVDTAYFKIKDANYVILRRTFEYDSYKLSYKEYYTIAQYEQACARCQHLAEMLRETGDEIIINNSFKFEVLISDAIQLNPQVDQAEKDEVTFQNNLEKLVSRAEDLFRSPEKRKRAFKEALLLVNQS